MLMGFGTFFAAIASYFSANELRDIKLKLQKHDERLSNHDERLSNHDERLSNHDERLSVQDVINAEQQSINAEQHAINIVLQENQRDYAAEYEDYATKFILLKDADSLKQMDL